MQLKITSGILVLLFLTSCENAPEPKQEAPIKPTEIPAEKTENLPSEETPVNLPMEKQVILIPTTYRDWEDQNPVDQLTKNWMEIYQKDGRYFVGKADYKITKGSDECSGSDTKTIEPRKDVVLMMDLPDLKPGEINALKIPQKKIWPKEKTNFRYNDINYFLRAEGEILTSEQVITDDGEEVFHDVKNYKLYISTGQNSEMLMLEEPSFDQTFVELLFVGDIDSDGKLDFMIGANRNYEEARVILFLSSKAKPGKIVQRAGEIAVQFDC